MTQTGDPRTPHPPTPDPPFIIDTPGGLAYLRRALDGVSRLAVDTESNSLFAYREQVCLIQLSTDEADYLVDPIRLDRPGSLDFLGDIFADPIVEIVLHAAEYDVRCLRRDFGFSFTNIFDTLIAARLLRWENISLGSILGQRFGVRVNKRHQRANWGRRPLSPDLIRYAQIDTHYLLALRDMCYTELQAGHHLEEARELFDEVCRAVWNGPEFDPEGFWNIKGARDLSPESAAVLRELYIYRENQAMQRDLPVFKVLGEQTLLRLADRKPRTLQEVRQIPGMSSGQIRRYGVGILKAIRRGLKLEPPIPPQPRRRAADELVMRRFEALHTWRKARAAARGIPSEFIASRDALWELAVVAPRTQEQLGNIRGLGPWRLKTYSREILQILAGVDGP